MIEEGSVRGDVAVLAAHGTRALGCSGAFARSLGTSIDAQGRLWISAPASDRRASARRPSIAGLPPFASRRGVVPRLVSKPNKETIRCSLHDILSLVKRKRCSVGRAQQHRGGSLQSSGPSKVVPNTT